MLFFVAFATHIKADLLPAIELQLLLAGCCFQINADNGNPALLFFADDEYRLALIFSAWCASLLRQGDNGHATGHRVIQQASNKALGLGGEAE